MTPTPLRLLSLCCLVCMANVVRAEDRAAPIRDDAKMLHSDAIDRAEQRIADIRDKFDRSLFVRTVDTAPSQRWFPLLRTPKVNRMLDEQARIYADESGAPGIYIVISKRPRDVRVLVRPEDDALFSRRDADSLRRTLAWRLHEKGADAVLSALVDRVDVLLKEHQERGPSVIVSDAALVGVMGGGLGFWLLLRLIRLRMRARSGRERKISPRSTTALYGAMFGCPAGIWIYDKLYPDSAEAAGKSAAVALVEPQPQEQQIEDRPRQGVGLG
jgi:hypothetical protein